MGRHRWNVDVDISTLKISTLNISLQFPCDSTRILFILFLARALPVWACFVFLIVFSYCSKATSQDVYYSLECVHNHNCTSAVQLEIPRR